MEKLVLFSLNQTGFGMETIFPSRQVDYRSHDLLQDGSVRLLPTTGHTLCVNRNGWLVTGLTSVSRS